MGTPKMFLSFSIILSFLTIVAPKITVSLSENRYVGSVVSKTKLFVFGDSYVDTGNSIKAMSSSWEVPYGITFPGRPTGRWSNGRVFSDYIAQFLGIKSPIPYRWRKFGKKLLPFGMNFAYGGTGIFDTITSAPNMTTQINLLHQVINSGIYKKHDLHSSIALVSVAGNDYTAYTIRNGSIEGLPTFITSLITQLTLDLKQIHTLGVGKIAVASIEPLGCLPRMTVSSLYKKCNETANSLSVFHNTLLEQAVEKLNNNTVGSPFVILDVYSAFLSVFNGAKQGKLKFSKVLKPCCLGTSTGYSCGSVDASGNKKYTVCKNPGTSFFWDMVHPGQPGWSAVYSVLRPSLHKILHDVL